MSRSRAPLVVLLVAATLQAAAEPTLRWTPPRDALFWGRVSPDGRYLAFGSGGDLNLYLRDLQSGVSRALTSRKHGEGVPGDDVWAFSPDGRQLAYSWLVEGHSELRVLPVRGSQSPARVLLADADIRWVTAWGWSSKADWIVVGVWRRGKNESELGLVTVANGAYRVLLRVPGAAPNNQGPSAVSADGRFVAYSPREQGKASRDIVLVPLSGGDPVPVVTGDTNDAVVGWSPDGRELVYSSDRDGKPGLWTVTIDPDGSARTPRRILEHLEQDSLLGLTADGTLVYRVSPPERWHTAVATVDFTTGQVRARAQPIEPIVSGAALQPDGWSPDGSTLALRSTLGDETADYFAVFLDEKTRQRQLRPKLAAFQRFFWSPDGRSIAVRGAIELNQCCGLFRLDPASGNTTLLRARASAVYGWTPNGKILFDVVSTDGVTDSSLVELDVASGAERVLHRWPTGEAGRRSFAIDPAGRTLFYRTPSDLARPPHRVIARDTVTGLETEILSGSRVGPLATAAGGRFALTSRNGELVLVPAGGGSVLAIPQVDQRTPEILIWSEDGRSFLGRTVREEAERVAATYWWVPIDGRTPRVLEIGIGPYAAGFVARGQHVAFGERVGVGNPASEIRTIPLYPEAKAR